MSLSRGVRAEICAGSRLANRRLALLVLSTCLALCNGIAFAQNRGVYPLGLSAVNSGVVGEAGFAYNNSFLYYARDKQVGADGEILATGQQAVVLDMNTVAWVSGRTIAVLGDARFSSAVTIPIAKNSLSSDTQGAISGGSGLGDAYVQPIILAWRTARADLRAIVGVLAPTGKFSAGATDNVGNGYWTPVIAAGETFYVSKDRATTLSAFEMYEFHGAQPGTAIRPGETFDLDYSLMHAFPLSGAAARLQVGIVGYAQWQTSAKTGPSISAAEELQRYRVNGLGVGLNVLLPTQKVTLGFKYFDEFENRWTYQGYSVQISAGIGF